MSGAEKAHWERVYSTKEERAVSWYQPHLENSLRLIERAAGGKSARILDVGGGRSTLVDDLLKRGYGNITVLDIASTALEATKARLGGRARGIEWLVADITEAELASGGYDVWHDRAVFHFLVAPEKRAAYVRQARNAVRAGGHVIVSTFGPQGPKTCSGLSVMRYDAGSLEKEFREPFHLVENFLESHRTPSGTIQQFLYCDFEKRK